MAVSDEFFGVMAVSENPIIGPLVRGDMGRYPLQSKAISSVLLPIQQNKLRRKTSFLPLDNKLKNRVIFTFTQIEEDVILRKR